MAYITRDARRGHLEPVSTARTPALTGWVLPSSAQARSRLQPRTCAQEPTAPIQSEPGRRGRIQRCRRHVHFLPGVLHPHGRAQPPAGQDLGTAAPWLPVYERRAARPPAQGMLRGRTRVPGPLSRELAARQNRHRRRLRGQFGPGHLDGRSHPGAQGGFSAPSGPSPDAAARRYRAAAFASSSRSSAAAPAVARRMGGHSEPAAATPPRCRAAGPRCMSLCRPGAGGTRCLNSGD